MNEKGKWKSKVKENEYKPEKFLLALQPSHDPNSNLCTRGLQFRYTSYGINTLVTFRYSYEFDSEIFVQKVIDFIIDKVTNYKLEIFKNSTVYYIEVVEGKLEFIDRETFKLNERNYLKKIGVSFYKKV